MLRDVDSAISSVSAYNADSDFKMPLAGTSDVSQGGSSQLIINISSNNYFT